MHSPNIFDYKIYTFNLAIKINYKIWKFIAPNSEFYDHSKISNNHNLNFVDLDKTLITLNY